MVRKSSDFLKNTEAFTGHHTSLTFVETAALSSSDLSDLHNHPSENRMLNANFHRSE